MVINLADSGPARAFASGTRKVRMPGSGKIIGITFNAQAKAGTHSTSTIDVQDDGVSLLVAPINVAAAVAGTPVDVEGAALAAIAANVRKDSVISIVMAEAGGAGPTWQGADLQIDWTPLSD
jgi:hypothetical protein